MSNYSPTQIHISDEKSMLKLGADFSSIITPGTIIFLNGDLGTGKTTLVRGFLRQLGYNGAVKSPTFTLVEDYTLNLSNSLVEEYSLYHFDLYRLADAEELDYMGISDYIDDQAIIFIEWPDKGQGFLPEADIILNIIHLGKHRDIEITSQTAKGLRLVNNFIS